MKRNMRLYIQDIWESILAIEEYTQNLAGMRWMFTAGVKDLKEFCSNIPFYVELVIYMI
ncbi:hypothetical protein BMS3Bbin15_00717 [archaeon BMS3Bbin15]|nr:hypothetical protein BMS3Bbin15_00717 [archaeon BMS3Bbin15]